MDSSFASADGISHRRPERRFRLSAAVYCATGRLLGVETRVAMVRAGDNAMPIAPSAAVWIGGLRWQVRRNAVAVSSLTT
jgi:hypothetical protein